MSGRESFGERAPAKGAGDARGDKVVVRVIVQRQVLEERADVDGVLDWYVVSRKVVSEREWIEDRAKALPRGEVRTCPKCGGVYFLDAGQTRTTALCADCLANVVSAPRSGANRKDVDVR